MQTAHDTQQPQVDLSCPKGVFDESCEAARTFSALVRPKILGLVAATMIAAAWLAGDTPPEPSAVAHIVWGTLWVMAGSVALNQAFEGHSDARMPRTAGRPVPLGRISVTQAAVLGAAAVLLGCIYLAVFAGWPVALLALGNAALYVIVYTPLKPKSPWQTPVGAAAGAMPVLLAAVAADAIYNARAWALFGVVFFWQFPHAMAIAWLYREQFAASGTRLATVVDPSGRSAGRWAVIGATALIPLGLVLTQDCGRFCAAGAVVLAAAGLTSAARFANRPSDDAARMMLRWSLAYLPVFLLWTVVARFW